MQTMQPVMLYGTHEWDEVALPSHEFGERLRAVQEVMRECGWKAMIVHGDTRENALLCYLSNFVPYLRWGLALVSETGPVRLIAAVGPRDLPAVRRATHVDDVRASGDIGASVADWLRQLPTQRAGRIAVVNLKHMRCDAAQRTIAACEDFGGALDAGDAFDTMLRALRPREIELLGRSHAILCTALTQIARARADGYSIKAAAVAGERAARLNGARDVRVLLDAGGVGQLSPIESTADVTRAESWSIMLAVRHQGYWSKGLTTFVAIPSPLVVAVRAALDAGLSRVEAGMPLSGIATAMQTELAGYLPHPVLGAGVCHPCGLSLDREPWLDSSSGYRLGEDDALTVAAGGRDQSGSCALASATVVLQRGRVEVLRHAH